MNARSVYNYVVVVFPQEKQSLTMSSAFIFLLISAVISIEIILWASTQYMPIQVHLRYTYIALFILYVS